MNGKNQESAISETIAVTLIVALTVIMAALVAAYLFGMIPNIAPSRNLAYTADQTENNNINVLYHGGPDESSLSFATVTVTESGGGTPTYANATHASNILGHKVGEVVRVTASTSNGFTHKDHVVVTAYFTNNLQQVVLDTFV
jgi:FlaG/FlaF family flagellin (archaellin)